MKKSKIFGGVAVAAVLGLAAFRLFGPKAAPEEEMIPVVETGKMEPGTIELYRDMTGTVEPSDVVYIYPKAAGEVTAVFVKAGDMVKAGDPICTIDTKQVESSRLSMEAAKAAYESAQSNYDRQKVLYEAGDVAKAAFEGVETQMKASKIQYEQAKLGYEYQLEFANITATIDGKIEKCDAEVHKNVANSMLICVIAGEGSKSVTFSVPEKIVGQQHPGDEITLTKNGMEYTGKITEVAEMIDASTGLFKVKASVDKGDALPTSSSVQLSVLADKAENVDTLPVDSIYYAGGKPYVYTYDNGTVHYIPVEVGIYDSERVQILSGIDKDAEVITSWSSELFEGSAVQKAEDAAPEKAAE